MHQDCLAETDRQLDSLELSIEESPSCCNSCACEEAGDTCELYRSSGQGAILIILCIHMTRCIMMSQFLCIDTVHQSSGGLLLNTLCIFGRGVCCMLYKLHS